jgi:sugar-specific transcriptional regulator TrmB
LDKQFHLKGHFVAKDSYYEIDELKRFISDMKQDFQSYVEKTSMLYKRFESMCNAKEVWELSEYKHTNKNTMESNKPFLNQTNEFISKTSIQKNSLLYVLEKDSEALKLKINELPLNKNTLNSLYYVEQIYKHTLEFEIFKFLNYQIKMNIYDLFFNHGIYLFDITELKKNYQSSQIDFLEFLKNIPENA